MPGGKPILKAAARAIFHQAGGLHVVRWMNRKGLRILMYHRFSNPVDLESQCRHIRQYYAPVSLDQVDRWLGGGDPLPSNAIAVTVDDGYRDFGKVAYPVFCAWGIPVTVYLVSDFLDGALWLWVDQVRFGFLQSPLQQFRAELPGGTTLEFRLDSRARRLAAARETCEALKRLSNADRLAALDCLPRWLEVELPEAPPEEDAPLGWDDVRQMAGSIATFGAHTRTHPVLSRLPAKEELRGEIEGSQRRMEEMLDRPVAHFCYPNGGPGDITPECIEAVQRAGFHTAVTTITGLNDRRADRYTLRRIGVEPGLDPLYFRQCAAAFRV